MSIVASGLGFGVGRTAGAKAFDKVWEKIDGDDPPNPGHRDAALPRLVLASALRSALAGVGIALVTRGVLVAMERLTGSWGGEEEAYPGGPQLDRRHGRV